MNGFTVALSIIVWLYTIVAVHNGGGFTTTLALLGSFGVAFVGYGWALWNGEYLFASAIIVAYIVGFLLQIRARDDGLMN